MRVVGGSQKFEQGRTGNPAEFLAPLTDVLIRFPGRGDASGGCLAEMGKMGSELLGKRCKNFCRLCYLVKLVDDKRYMLDRVLADQKQVVKDGFVIGCRGIDQNDGCTCIRGIAQYSEPGW
jgi:hypothetical protein